jgi:DNA-binding HxlR family transcriptional regulator
MTFSNRCPVAFTTRVIGGKWKARIVWALIRNDKLRFSELRRACPPISDRILSKELKELEDWALVSRKEYPVVPPKTEYRLTEMGWTLEPVMAAMAEWGGKHRESIAEPAGAAARSSRRPLRA